MARDDAEEVDGGDLIGRGRCRVGVGVGGLGGSTETQDPVDLELEEVGEEGGVLVLAGAR